LHCQPQSTYPVTDQEDANMKCEIMGVWDAIID
jgi:hypothetical protein